MIMDNFTEEVRPFRQIDLNDIVAVNSNIKIHIDSPIDSYNVREGLLVDDFISNNNTQLSKNIIPQKHKKRTSF